MEVVVERAAGLDVHQRTVVAAVRTPEGRRVRTFGTMLGDLEQLAAWLAEQGVTDVAMEATGVYWQPVYNVLEERPFTLLVVNAQHFKGVPGRKTDVGDAEWLAELLQHGLLRGSFIPEREQRERRELVRYRKALIRERASAVNRLQKLLEGANLKLASVASDVAGVSGRQMLEAMLAGEEDPAVLAALAKGSLKRKQDQLAQALAGRLRPHQRFLLREQLDHLEELDGRIARLSQELEQRLAPFADALALLETIPGIGHTTAQVIVAEVGADLGRFPSAAHLASWAGVCPGNRESAGKRQSGRIRKGNPWLKEVLVEAAQAASRRKGSYLQAQYRRLAARRGRKRALVALAHTLLVIVYHVLTTKQPYQELGPDYFDRRQREAKVRRLTKDLEHLGYVVSLTPAA